MILNIYLLISIFIYTIKKILGAPHNMRPLNVFPTVLKVAIVLWFLKMRYCAVSLDLLLRTTCTAAV